MPGGAAVQTDGGADRAVLRGLDARFIVWSGKHHPKEMGADEVKGFLTHLAVQRRVAAATQNQALNALVFLYKEVIGGELGWLDGPEPAKRGQRLPTDWKPSTADIDWQRR